MKRLTILAAVAGLVLFGVVVAFSGAGEILQAVQSAGWGTALVVLVRAIAIAADGIGWNVLFPPGRRLESQVAMLLRWVRESINQLLPVAAVGGDFIGARLATFWRCEGAMAWASVIADIGVQAGTQLLFAVLGLGLLVWLVGDSELVHYVAAGIGIAALGLGGFVLLQRRGGAKLFLAIGQKLAAGREWAALAAVERFYERLREIYENPRGVAASVAIHSGVWIFGSLEVWIAFHFMGYPIGFAEAIVIESLGQAVRGAAFAVPGGLGVQEGGFVAICSLFGIPAGPAVALSLVKRVSDLAIGLPGLVVWQWIEARRALGKGPDLAGDTGLAEGRR
ncbi:flippase-like domain-containing protein [Enterovirga aerilata]|uniref:Flippase-like domain-containing protein n=1 Tax=Enterovirga aerilata TaxID=2730920 RepID=A0A849I704_9HYPH|nr:flippase-like domain-containing protein [Enterovirga sp. DB1703]NNM71817.1 flippase-like domain-containing protein [Enterovirga sp. DB1703]